MVEKKNVLAFNLPGFVIQEWKFYINSEKPLKQWVKYWKPILFSFLYFLRIRGKNVLFNATEKNNKKKKSLQEKCDKKVEIETPV